MSRTPYRIRDLLLVIVMVAIFSWLLAYVGPSLDERDMQQSIALSDAQRQAERELRRDLAAAALCREQHGETLIRWTAAGELVCIPRHGKQVLATNP